jgi:hypothetical protein
VRGVLRFLGGIILHFRQILRRTANEEYFRSSD